MIPIGTTIESPQTGERLTFLSTAESSNGEVFRAELTVQPCGYVVGDHIHPNQEERFVVLDGLYGWRIGSKTGVARAGSTLICPPGVSHMQWNAGDTPMRIYYEHRPALESAEIFFETQFGLSREGKLGPGGKIGLLQAAALLEEVSDFIRPASPPVFLQNLIFPPLAIIAKQRGYRARYAAYASEGVSPRSGGR